MDSFYQTVFSITLFLIPLLVFTSYLTFTLGRPEAAFSTALLVLTVFLHWGSGYLADQAFVVSQRLGTFKSVQVGDENLFTRPISVIETSQGFFSVRGSVNAARGANVTEQRNLLGDTRICVAQTCYDVTGNS